MKVIFLSILAVVALQGCSKNEDSNQDANGACKQEYIDSWNAVANTKNYPSLYSSEKNSACSNLKAKGDVSCKAHVMVFGGDEKSSDRNISYSDFKDHCEPALTSSPYSPSTPPKNYDPDPAFKYRNLSGDRCSQDFVDLYNKLVNEKQNLDYYASDSMYGVAANKRFSKLCAEKKTAESGSISCLAEKSSFNSYSYNNSVRVSLAEFNSVCIQAEKNVAAVDELKLARSVRVFSKVEEFEGSIEVGKVEELKKFNSTGGAHYLVDGKWLKKDTMKTVLTEMQEDKAICNVTLSGEAGNGIIFKGSQLVEAKESAVNSLNQQTTELYKVTFTLTAVAIPSYMAKIRCYKKSEITIDDVESALGKNLTLKANKIKK